MANIQLSGLAAAIDNELSIYHDEVVKKVNVAGANSIKKLVKLTRASAPADTGEYKKHIVWSPEKTTNGATRYVWHVKAPHYRLTHLLVHGHANVDGSRTAGNPFLQNALDTVLPEYERAVEEAIRNG